ncbi:MAG TPA: MFS transporter [Terrimicrobiaceae bacterium]
MNTPKSNTSIWLALENPVFRRLWLATVISGTCVAAHNTAAFSALGTMGNSAFLISQMSTLSALPFALFTLPAGALADMIDRKKILCAVSLWQASIAICLTILGLTHLLNPYIILASVFLFNLGFAFGSPTSSSVIAEMVSKDELASANTLGGLQINIAGMIGPVLGGLLIPVMGASFVFGANGLGFLLMFLAILQWRRVRAQTPVPLDAFFATVTTAINYARYTPGIKVVLARNAFFSFFISIIPALMPVVGLKELHLDPAKLGYLFTSMGIGSVIGAVFVIPWARARFSPNTLTIYANLLLVLNLFLMAHVQRPYLFLLVAAVAGAGWTLSSTELWIAGQRAMPDWARGRMNATIIMISQAATALGGATWGAAASKAGVVPTFLVAGALAILFWVVTHVVLQKRLSIDFTASLNFEPAAVTIFSHDLDPRRLTQAKDNPVSVTTEFLIDSACREQCIELMREARLIYLRNGASGWHLYEDLTRSNKFLMEVTSPSWNEFLRQRERMTKDEKEVMDKLRNLHVGAHRLGESPRVSIDKQVLKKRVRFWE